MAKRRPRMLPKTERNDSEKSIVDIISIDRKTNTIHAQVNGYKITAVCREQANPDVYDRVKGILIGSIIH